MRVHSVLQGPMASSRAPGASTARRLTKWSSTSTFRPRTRSSPVTRRCCSALTTSCGASCAQPLTLRSSSPSSALSAEAEPPERATSAASRSGVTRALTLWFVRSSRRRHTPGDAAAARHACDTHAAAHNVAASPLQDNSTRSSRTTGSGGTFSGQGFTLAAFLTALRSLALKKLRTSMIDGRGAPPIQVHERAARRYQIR